MDVKERQEKLDAIEDYNAGKMGTPEYKWIILFDAVDAEAIDEDGDVRDFTDEEINELYNAIPEMAFHLEPAELDEDDRIAFKNATGRNSAGNKRLKTYIYQNGKVRPISKAEEDALIYGPDVSSPSRDWVLFEAYSSEEALELALADERLEKERRKEVLPEPTAPKDYMEEAVTVKEVLEAAAAISFRLSRDDASAIADIINEDAETYGDADNMLAELIPEYGEKI